MEKLIAYCMKTKSKEEMLNATVQKKGNKYFALGETKDGNKMSLILSEANALKAIENGLAKKGY